MQQRRQRIRVSAADVAVARDQEQALAHGAEQVADLAPSLGGGVCCAAGAPGEIQHGGQQQRGQARAAEQQAAQRPTVVHDRLAQPCRERAQLGFEGGGVARLRGQQFVDRALERGARRSECGAARGISVKIRLAGLHEASEPGIQRLPADHGPGVQRRGVGAGGEAALVHRSFQARVRLVAGHAAGVERAQGIADVGAGLEATLDERQFRAQELRLCGQARGELERRGYRLQARGQSHAREQQQGERRGAGRGDGDRQPLDSMVL